VKNCLRAERLEKRYGDRKVVDGVKIELQRGEIVGLLGPNGAGKTTTFYILVGLIKPNKGGIFLNDREITRTPMYKRARMGIGYLSQESSVFRKLTVEQNLRSILETLPLSKQERAEKLENLLSELNLEHLRDHKAFSLSGGEKKRLEITRALVSEPSFMLMDEPFAGVDPITVDDVQSIVARLRDKGIGVLITDHNVRETLEITNRAYVMFEGKIILSGKAEELINDPRARELYLGEDFKM
jgi:lipopolysaccharide export system ATP-binding protein